MIACLRKIGLPVVLFQDNEGWNIRRSIRTEGVGRDEFVGAGGEEKVLDHFTGSGIRCGFFRLPAGQDGSVHLEIPVSRGIRSCRGGGWVVAPLKNTDPYYWIPQAPALRVVTSNRQIAKEILNPATEINISVRSASLKIETPPEYALDVVAWEIPSQESTLLASLRKLTTVETQPVFLWGSHSLYRRPADLYQHVIFGHVYENRYQWPSKRKSCSENDAHSLYVTLCGLERATGKELYALLKNQLLISVLARQSSDGGWHHGEWSEDMEAHIRLNGSAIHLLLDSLDERDDPTVRQALERAVNFISRHTDNTAVGTWFLHDSLELNEEGMRKSPFTWVPSRVLGKSPSNMMVLNTHLDCIVLLDRYRHTTGDVRYADLIDSAKHAARAVLALRPLGSIYRAISLLLGLTLLPTPAQKKLSLPLRALKRLTWKWIKPNFFKLTSRYPRFVMPGGYIERAIALRGVVDDYHSINVMDLLRYWRRFPEENLEPLIHDAVRFVGENGVDDHWGESPAKKYALGFWAEALYHRYSLAPDGQKLADLARTMIKLERLGIGLPPSLLGANAETVAQGNQKGCPSPSDIHLRVANLSNDEHTEFLVVNPTTVARELMWEEPSPASLSWQTSVGNQIDRGAGIQLAPLGWAVGRANSQTNSQMSFRRKEQRNPGVLSA
jgi:hypothetical protein